MSKLQFTSVQMDNGEVFDGNRIGELVKEVINKLSDANLTCDEGKIILDKAKEVVGEYSLIKKMIRDSSVPFLVMYTK